GGRGGGDDEEPFAVEEVGDGPGAAHVTAAALESLADLAIRAVAVVGQDVADDGRAAGPEPLVDQLLHLRAFELAGAALDGPLDIVAGHGDGPGLVDRVAQLEVRVRVAAAGRGGDDDVAAEFAEQLGACRVLLALADGDVRRMGMPGHDASSPRGPSVARRNTPSL